LTEIALILDRSGSMENMAKEAIGGFNGFLESHRKEPGQAKLSLVLFDHEYIVAQDGRPIEESRNWTRIATSPAAQQPSSTQSVGQSRRSANG
jgi:hypothetical protein